MNDAPGVPPATRRYRWPWILAALVILWVALSVYAVRREAQRVREQRQFETTPQGK